MGYFPVCMDLKSKTVLLVGNGPQIREKRKKLKPFGCILHRVDRICAEDLTADVAFVVVGDTTRTEAARISALCMAERIPVNVVDEPDLCSFFFPALICRGELNVSVSTGGRSPGAAGYLASQIGEQLPERTEEILLWLSELRTTLYNKFPKEQARHMLSGITRHAFALGRPLTDGEIINFH